MQGRFDELIELLKKALEIKPNYPDAHNNLGIALQHQGDLELPLPPTTPLSNSSPTTQKLTTTWALLSRSRAT